MSDEKCQMKKIILFGPDLPIAECTLQPYLKHNTILYAKYSFYYRYDYSIL